MEEVETIKNERDVIEVQLKTSDSDGIRARLISAFQESDMSDENAIVVTEIESIYAPLREQGQSNFRRQEQLVGNIERAHNRFQEETKGNSSSALREEMLKNLARAYDVFQELLANLNEGTKVLRRFYLMWLALIRNSSCSSIENLRQYYSNFRAKSMILSLHEKLKKTI